MSERSLCPGDLGGPGLGSGLGGLGSSKQTENLSGDHSGLVGTLTSQQASQFGIPVDRFGLPGTMPQATNVM